MASSVRRQEKSNLRCDWVPEQASWGYLARSGLPAMSRKKNFPESHIINTLLTSLFGQNGWKVASFFFWRVYGPQLRLGQ